MADRIASKPILSKATRRAIYWGLFATALTVFVATVVLNNRNNAFYVKHSFAFGNVIAGAISMLLVWCAVFVSDE
jgi:hypothetical protein